MYKKNHDILYNIDFRILDEKYLGKLGKDKINLITCYSKTQATLLLLNNSQLEILTLCINSYLENNNTEEWQQIAEQILKHISEYDDLISSIDDIDNLHIAL